MTTIIFKNKNKKKKKKLTIILFISSHVTLSTVSSLESHIVFQNNIATNHY